MAAFRSVTVDGVTLNRRLSALIDEYLGSTKALIGSGADFERLAKEKQHYVALGVKAYRIAVTDQENDHFLCAALQVITNYVLTLDTLFDAILDAGEQDAEPVTFELCRDLAGLIETPKAAEVFGLDTANQYYNPRRYVGSDTVSLPEVANIFRAKTGTLTTFTSKAQARLRHILEKNGLRVSDIGLIY